ncbi:hydroxymethylbilane synthase [Candidatus Rhodoluna planktonica]|uniref:Porphobilinogen deaminase n=1 Tax=Candidatus Rhodoluna planktonica TaxID=535712 RepID=A0A1D9E0L8_9MICO|nr:hydroxymethylbilane synthase [Candidatus Rhodoluna planktonica]AOY56589.1 hypothetical protein A4Z71_06515 [Candidatus Rhodoluna planktonica]
MKKTKLRVGTRGSLLALTQTRIFTGELTRLHPEIEIEEVLIQTHGDLSTEPLSESKTPGVFVNALRDALLNFQVDFIVHSMKDLPANPHPAIATACVPSRQDSRDGLVSKNNLRLDELPSGAIVGTSSPRRAASIRQSRPDLVIADIRGNIDTRIAKVQGGEYDATLLAMAGLNRIDKSDAVCEIFETENFVPAAGQGALSIECRWGDSDLISLLAELDDAETRLVTTAERSVLSGLEAGCATAIGASAKYVDGTLILMTELAVESTGESQLVKRSAHSSLDDIEAATRLGHEAAKELLGGDLARKAAWK